MEVYIRVLKVEWTAEKNKLSKLKCEIRGHMCTYLPNPHSYTFLNVQQRDDPVWTA